MSVETQTFTLTVNGQTHSVQAYPMARVLDVLREELRLTGVKEGCGEGECGSCSILLDGKLVNSCLLPIAQAEGLPITTVETLSRDELGRRLQESFHACGGAQCGICTPGMLLASYQLLKANPQPTREQVQVALAGNLCRCTGYMKIFESVESAAGASS